MSLRIPARRLGQPCLVAFRPRTAYWASSNRAFTSSARSAKDDPKDVDLSNPILDAYLTKRGVEEKPTRPVPKTGNLSQTGIFKPELEIPGYRPGMTEAELELLKDEAKETAEEIAIDKEKRLHALRLDPLPAARRRYERKLVIKGVQKRRESKALHLKRTEREMVYKSHDLPTSMKKMTRLMHLIAGKTVEEALIQLRFSKKRVARDIVKGLQLARDEAIAARGMGLGAAIDAEAAEETDSTRPYLADGSRRRETKRDGTPIELKDGSKKFVSDPTEMYIDQAWASKGHETKSVEFRARGRTNLLHHRSAKFNVLLKEEKTRMRISDEIKKKRANKPLWQPLPDRPVTAQRQYCLW